MSQPNHNANDRDELIDRLVDRALAETLGGQTPPDLSERILARASGAPALESTPATHTEAAMENQQLRPAQRRSWKLWAIAATLAAVAAGLTLPDWNPGREAARRTTRNEARRSTTDAKSVATSDLAEGEQLHRESNDSFGDAYFGYRSKNGSENAQTDSLRMMVTPHVIVDAEPAGAKASIDAGVADAPADGAGRLDRVEQGVESEAVAAKPAAPARMFARQAPMGQAAPATTAPVNKLTELAKLNPNAAGLHAATAPASATLSDAFGSIRADSWYDGQGEGPDASGDKYARIEENEFKAISSATTDNRLSTFSIDVDTASYANVRQFLLGSQQLPPPDAVRIEELVNYFDYDYSAPTGDVPFASNVEVAACPWKPEHRLVRVGIKGRDMDRSRRPKSNLVFLIDVSGSMDEPAKLPLLVEGMKLLTRELGENDRVAIVVYASTEGLVLDSTAGTEQATILESLDRLSAGGSTAGGAGIQLAYRVAKDNFIKDGVNRVILCTDGDFNVGVTSPAELEQMAETNAKETGVFLTVLGFGRGNLNDAMMEQIADKGNGNYHYVDTRSEAKKVLVEEMVGTLVTIAKDVKIQIEFNPAKVAGYRLIGYENRVMAAEDFNNDAKDAGEIGAGHTVTALYEVVPLGLDVEAAKVDELKYRPPSIDYDGIEPLREGDAVLTELPSDDLLTLKIRYKAPDGDTSEKLEFPIADNDQPFAKASEDFKFASAVASFGMLLRQSQHKGNATFAAVAEIAEAASRDRDPHGYRKEFVEMVARAKQLSGE